MALVLLCILFVRTGKLVGVFKSKMEFVFIVFLRIGELLLVFIPQKSPVSARVRNIDCDFFVQNCVPCLAGGECFCKSESDFVSLQCNKRIGERRGCFEIFDAESEFFLL
jgi:hypothetical protein